MGAGCREDPPEAFEGLESSRTLRIRVLDASGVPVPTGTKVILADRAKLYSERLDSEGRAQFEGLPPGSYRARITVGEALHGETIELPAGTGVHGVDVHLP